MDSLVVYRDYCDSDVDAVVQMWKESRPGWPPGFFGASEITTTSVAKEEKSSGKLFTLLAFMGDRIVGFCRTSPYGGEPSASYVDLLNVVPDVHGKGVGKALLLDAVKRSAAKGMKRIDLHTWPSNMKAVPLYKKTGFFWVPDTMVYMQNYIPYLLGRDEFIKFLDGEDWYSCFERALLVEPDLEKTESGREIFRYVFKRGADSFVAEFDRKGRCISSIAYPGFSAGLSLESSSSDFFVGKSYPVSLSGSGFAMDKVSLESGKSLRCGELSSGSVEVEPESVRVAKSPREPADCVSALIAENGLELGIGMVGVEEVTLYSNPVHFLSPGTSKLKIGLKKLADVSSVVVNYAVDEGEFYSRVVALGSDIFQNCTIEIPELEQGVHTLSLRLGEYGYLETLVFVCGVYCGKPVALDTRKSAVIVGNDTAIIVPRKGAYGGVYGRGESDTPIHLGGFFVGAGPPSVWNSDLPKQTYTLELTDGQITGRTLWPSRPGMTHWVSVRLDPAGFVETFGGVDNDSEVHQKVLFRVRHSSGQVLKPSVDLIPLQKGLLVEPRVFNQLPDWEEDLPSSISGLGAPWIGVKGGGKALMSYFPEWTDFEYDAPGTSEVDVAPGESLISPPFRMLCVNGSESDLLRQAENLGWDTGNWKEKTVFLAHDLKPVMASGTAVSLSHPLCGERDGLISACGETLCSGKIKSGVSVSGVLTGDGAVDVGMSVAERETLMPVYLVSPAAEVSASSDSSGNLILSSEGIEAKIDPSAFGHVYSLKVNSVEYIMSSNPEPSTFAWEKPWYGGIHPRVQDNNENPYPMQDKKPEVVEYAEQVNGLTEKGWQMTWKIDHKKYGSFIAVWRVGLVPGVPVLKTSFECTASSGEYVNGEIDLRGFLQPGGSVEETVLTCDAFPGLVQGRKHAGSWAHMGKWARVQRKNSFVEAYSTGDGQFFSEDYAAEGCHFSVFSGREKAKKMKMEWLFGTSDEDEVIASVFRAHR